MDRQNKFDLLLAVDDAMAPYAAVTILSAARHVPGSSFHIFTLGLSQENISRFNTLSENYRISLKIYKIASTSFDGIQLRHYPLTALLRLKAAQVLSNLDCVLYLDCDIMAKNSFHSLYSLDLSACSAAVVQDGIREAKVAILSHRRDIGLRDVRRYFNSGVMLINLRWWRENDVFEKAKSWFKDFGQFEMAADQDALNSVLQDSVLFVSERWNFTGSLADAVLFKGWKGAPYRDELKNVIFFHYSGRQKPWSLRNKVLFQREWLSYLSKTPWAIDAYPRLSIRSIWYRAIITTKFFGQTALGYLKLCLAPRPRE